MTTARILAVALASVAAIVGAIGAGPGRKGDLVLLAMILAGAAGAIAA